MKKILILLAFSVAVLNSAGTLQFEKLEIVTGENPSTVVRFAAGELATFLGRSGKCSIPVVAVSSAPFKIVLGANAEGLIPEPHEFIISAKPGGIVYIAGFDDPGHDEKSVANLLHKVHYKGTLEGVYYFLEKYAGVRWTEPGKDGEYVPEKSTLQVPDGTERVKPVFTDRRMYHFDGVKFPDLSEYGTLDDLYLWALRLRSGSWLEPVFGCHPVNNIKMKESFAAAHPDWFALQPDGKRNFSYLCWSNPEVVDFWVKLADAFFSGKTPEAAGIKMNWWNHPYINRDEFMIDPHDMYEKFACQCERCQAFKAKFPENGLSELIWNTILQAAGRIGEMHPDKAVTTLAYPPKKAIPTVAPLTKNLRVRMTTGGPNQITGAPEGYRQELELLRNWSEALGKPVPLWIYINSPFGNGMTGPPEITTHNFQKFLQDIRPWSNGMFVELSEPSHTVVNKDIYAMFKLLWNPDTDLVPLLDEYFAIQYGDAGPAMKELFAEFEANWNRVLTETWTKESSIHPTWHRSSKYRKTMWEKIYTNAELDRLTAKLKAAEKLVKPGSIYAKRINRVERRVLEFMRGERAAMMDDNAAYRRKTVIHVRKLSEAPSEADWNSVPWIPMVSAETVRRPVQPSQFKVLADERNFYLRGEFTDSAIDRSLSKKDRKQGDCEDIWNDNEVELFFYSADMGFPVQVVITDRGIFGVNRLREDRSELSSNEPVKVKAEIQDKGWTLEAVIPNEVSGLTASGDNRFNLIRARNSGGVKNEYSTWSPEAVRGKWMSQAYYGQINFMTGPLAEKQVKYSGQAMPPQGEAVPSWSMDFSSDKLVEWANWRNPGARTVFSRDPNVGRTAKGSLLIDMSNDSPDGKDPGASWHYSARYKPGTKLRMSVWAMCETTNPDAMVLLRAGWHDNTRRWVKFGQLFGAVEIPATPGEWQYLAFDIIVPENENVVLSLMFFGSRNAYPGRVWFDDAKIEIVK